MLNLINNKTHLNIEGVNFIKKLRELQHYYRKNINPKLKNLIDLKNN
jgi:hypothetical protein